MNTQDLALYHEAEALANNGKTLAAYRLFCMVENHGNPDIEVNFWILQTTPNQWEARQLLAQLEQITPQHHLLPQARMFIEQRWRNAVLLPVQLTATGPVLTCSYCGTTAPTVPMSHVHPAGWVLMVVIILLTILLNWTTFNFLWVGLFIPAGLLIRLKHCMCNRCRGELRLP
jgi:hypothetical protein